MKKGQQTRQRILEETAPLFNQQGYAGLSLTTIMAATQLEKGGIYRHFHSKEDLALASFEYTVATLRQHFRQAFQQKKHAVERLFVIIEHFGEIVEKPLIAGGCPLLNTAIEADDAYPFLRDAVREAMQQWFVTIQRIVQKGIERQELRPESDGEMVATLFLSSLEGAVMLSRLYQDATYMQRTMSYLKAYVQRELQASSFTGDADSRA